MQGRSGSSKGARTKTYSTADLVAMVEFGTQLTGENGSRGRRMRAWLPGAGLHHRFASCTATSASKGYTECPAVTHWHVRASGGASHHHR